MSSTTAQLAIQAAKWKSDPPTEDEKKEFLKTTIKDLENPEMATEVSKNLEGLAVTAVKTDEAFDKVGRYFKNFVDQSGKDFPGLAGYLTQWTGHQNVSPCSLILLPLDNENFIALEATGNSVEGLGSRDSLELSRYTFLTVVLFRFLILDLLTRLRRSPSQNYRTLGNKRRHDRSSQRIGEI